MAEQNSKSQYNTTAETLNSSDSEVDHNISEEDSAPLSKSHVFEDPTVAKYYNELYHQTKYEGRNHFDPKLEWTKAEERALLKKTEWRVTFWAFFMFFALDIDRSNINNALSANMLTDLHLTTNDYNVGKTINLICFLSSELPSQLISKKVGPDRWIPTQMVLWSLVAICQVAIQNKAGFFVTRGLLGLCQGGFIPDICLWLSYFYTGTELPMRLGLFYVANNFTSAISSLLAYGIFRLNGHHGIEGWRWLFLLEGLFTLIIGILSFFRMPASAVQTKTWFRPKGWYTEREEKIMVNRILRDDPSKGDMHNREALTLGRLWKSLTDYDLWPVYIVRLLGDINVAPVGNYLTLTLRKLGFSTLNTNLLTIPPYLLGIVTMLACCFGSELVNQRALIIAIQSIWILPFLFVLRFWPGAQVNVWATYAVLVVCLGYPPMWTLTITWLSTNSNSVRSRTVSAAVVNMFSQTAGIIAANIYRQDDAPLYKRGNSQLIGIAFGALASCFLAKFYYIWRNNQRDKIWNAMTKEEQLDYIENTADEGNKRLDFRFIH
jgi:sugar phosphate permease